MAVDREVADCRGTGERVGEGAREGYVGLAG